MTTTVSRDQLAVRRLNLMIFYNGPWGRLSNWLWKTGQLQLDDQGVVVNPDVVVQDTSIRGRLAMWADNRDWVWRERHAQRGTTPHKRWKAK